MSIRRAQLTSTLAACLAGIGAASQASAQTTFRGPAVAATVRRSVDVHDSHLQLLQGNAFRGELLDYLTFTTRWAPGEFVLNTGDRVGGNLARIQVGAGFGFGKASDWGVFGGLFFDAMATPGAPGMSFGGAQQLMHFGVAVSGVQVTVSGKLGGADFGLDPWDNFQRESADDEDSTERYRPRPGGVDFPTFENETVTVFEGRSGAYASVTFGDRGVQNLRLRLQPLVRLLPDAFGLPGIGLRVLDGVEQRLARSESVRVELEDEPLERQYTLDLVTDDALGLGVHARFAVDVRPTVKFRRADLGFVRLPEEVFRALKVPLGVGARVSLAQPLDALEFSAESFVLYGLFASDDGTYPVQLGASHSYNSPDASTFIPIEDAHVFGAQLIWGDPAAAKPLIPMVRGLGSAAGARTGGSSWE